MEKKIEQYLPLYLGQSAKVIQYDLFEYKNELSLGDTLPISLETLSQIQKGNLKLIPILRPLSSMTEEEERELGKIALPECDNPRSRFVLSMESTGKNSEGTSMMDNYTPEMVLWLLSKGFDIFRLKEKGLCSA